MSDAEKTCLSCRHILVFYGCSLRHWKMEHGDTFLEWQDYLDDAQSCPDFEEVEMNPVKEIQELKTRIAALEQRLKHYESLKGQIALAWQTQAADARILARIMAKLGFTLDLAFVHAEAADQIQQQAQSLLDSLDTKDETEEP